jgi:signal transduction histidine kinase
LLEPPSWWTAEHALWVSAGMLAVFCASLAWVAVLRKQVKAQMKIISQKVQREAALEERTRIARDLHDDLGAGLTHISFLSQVAGKEKECPPGVGEHLREISTSAQESFEALDAIVWVVNPKNDTIDSLANYICHFAEDFFRNTSTRCRLDLPASLPERPIPTEIRNNLFFALKEALHNVRRHARAAEVLISVRMDSSLFTISIEDNGQGFVPESTRSAGNGLVNMRKRLEKVGGQFTLQSRPGSGTTIRLTVPL